MMPITTDMRVVALKFVACKLKIVARKKAAGFTLIELLVTVALVGLLALIAMPFTGDWTATQRVQETQTVLQQAIETAKARAMRNETGLSDNPVAVVCVVEKQGAKTLEVRQLNRKIENNDPCTDGALNDDPKLATVLWSSSLKGDVELQHEHQGANAALSYMYFDNRGSLTTNYGVCPPASCPKSGAVVHVASKRSNVDELKFSVF